MGGIVSAPSALLAQYTEPGEEGAVYGLDNSIVAASRALAPLIGAGVALWFGMRGTFAATAVLFVVVIIAAMIFLHEEHEEEPQFQPVGAGD
jgi:DHA1 family multidrug resistance protein-like MFS transporter